MPTGSVTAPASFPGLSMVLTGGMALQGNSILAWENTTARYIESFFQREPSFGVSDVTAEIVLTGQSGGGRRRRLQQSVTLVFTETVSYRATNPNLDPTVVLEEPFFLSSRRFDYVRDLRATGDPAFQSVTSTQPLMQPVPPAEDEGLSTIIIVIIVVCGVVALCLVAAILYFVYRRQSPHKGYRADVDDGVPATSVPKDGGEDVSTLDPDKTGGGPPTESLGGYGDQR